MVCELLHAVVYLPDLAGHLESPRVLALQIVLVEHHVEHAGAQGETVARVLRTRAAPGMSMSMRSTWSFTGVRWRVAGWACRRAGGAAERWWWSGAHEGRLRAAKEEPEEYDVDGQLGELRAESTPFGDIIHTVEEDVRRDREQRAPLRGGLESRGWGVGWGGLVVTRRYSSKHEAVGAPAERAPERSCTCAKRMRQNNAVWRPRRRHSRYG